ncbi:NAD(P)-binding protein [Tothia fuscella]|uniref:NAD(P)-binding protein n=1 Tax=Tothia fuscella TaxID=1048955 RepID=A0A9P4NUR3_9PEZI|nr:NAD(P)-binding protein [Tothia fuscella]
MPLTILTDDDVRTLLHSLTKRDILELQQSLADALHYYSTSVEDDDNGCCASYQPERTALKRKDGTTTLFMPANSNEGMGVKIVTLTEVCATSMGKDGIKNIGRMSGNIGSMSGSNSGSFSSVSGDSGIDTPSSGIGNAGTSPTGSLTLLANNGTMRALVNAAEITAFRTALASTILFKKRNNVHDIAIFGAGKQAYWHARLALLLRGDEIHHLNIINRSFDTAGSLLHDLYKIPWPVSIHHPQTSIITPNHTEYHRYLKSTIRASSVIFCTTPSTEPLFPAEYLTSTEGRKKGRYVAAIGSYKPHMIELHPDILQQAVANPNHKHHHHRHAKQGGAIVVDSVEACLKEAGEIIQAGLGGREVVELGELVMLKRDAEAKRRDRRESESSLDSAGVELGGGKKGKGAKEKDEGGDGDGGLGEWLTKGNVVYKSVGLGLMDVVVGGELVRLADERGVGTRLERF